MNWKNSYKNFFFKFFLFISLFNTILSQIGQQQQSQSAQNVNPAQEGSKIFTGLGTNPVYGGEFNYKFIHYYKTLINIYIYAYFRASQVLDCFNRTTNVNHVLLFQNFNENFYQRKDSTDTHYSLKAFQNSLQHRFEHSPLSCYSLKHLSIELFDISASQLSPGILFPNIPLAIPNHKNVFMRICMAINRSTSIHRQEAVFFKIYKKEIIKNNRCIEIEI